MKSPLEISSYFFPAVSVAADAEFKPAEDTSPPHIEVKVSVDHVENNTYQVALEITFGPENEEKKQPYAIEMIAIGIFHVAPDFPDPEKLMRLNGAAILYGAAREFLITITSRGPWGAVTIPSISFLRPEDIEPHKATKKSKKKATENIK
jgi:preprotein translocase subunit SecB